MTCKTKAKNLLKYGTVNVFEIDNRESDIVILEILLNNDLIEWITCDFNVFINFYLFRFNVVKEGVVFTNGNNRILYDFKNRDDIFGTDVISVPIEEIRNMTSEKREWLLGRAQV